MYEGTKKYGKIIIEIEYDGDYPNLCSGDLWVTINRKKWHFPDYCLVSGGTVWFDENYDEHVESGGWDISKYPPNFPKELKELVLDAINDLIPWGCCGGCV